MEIVAAQPLPSPDLALCRHCGDPCGAGAVRSTDGDFCCRGCESVFTVLQRAGLGGFYACEINPGTSQKQAERRDARRFAALDDPAIAARLIAFNNGTVARVSFPVPAIHCSSCV